MTQISKLKYTSWEKGGNKRYYKKHGSNRLQRKGDMDLIPNQQKKPLTSRLRAPISERLMCHDI